MQVGRKVDLIHTKIFSAKLRGLSAPCKSLQGLQRFAYPDSFSFTLISLISKFLQTLQRFGCLGKHRDLCPKEYAMKTEKLYQALMRRLPDAGHDNYYAISDKKSRVLLTAIRLLLDKFEPIGDDYRHGLWIEVPRGKPSDWGSFKEAKDCYEEVNTMDDYLKYWQEEFPRETYWYYLSIGQYNGHTYLHISEQDMH